MGFGYAFLYLDVRGICKHLIFRLIRVDSSIAAKRAKSHIINMLENVCVF